MRRKQPREPALVLLTTAAVVFLTAGLFNWGSPDFLAPFTESRFSDEGWFWFRFILSGFLVPAGCLFVIAYLRPRTSVALWTGRQVLELSGAMIIAWLSVLMLTGFHGINYLVPRWFDQLYFTGSLLWIIAFPAALIVLISRWLFSRAGVVR